MFKVIMFIVTIFLLSGCHNYSANVGEVLGCTLAGNGCDDGRTGPQGEAGQDAASCTVSSVSPGPVAPNGGAQLICPNGSSALLLNGEPGEDGIPPFGITKVVKPCPGIFGSNPEILLILSDRTVIASVSQAASGNNTRLAIVTPGSYVTTDGRGCLFTVHSNKITWTGGSVTY